MFIDGIAVATMLRVSESVNVVAELLNRKIPLLRDLGVDVRWDLIKGGIAFFEVTKKFHNLLHGRPEEISKTDFEIFIETSQKNIKEMTT